MMFDCSYTVLNPAEVSFFEGGCPVRVFGGASGGHFKTLVGCVEEREERPSELLGLQCRN